MHYYTYYFKIGNCIWVCIHCRKLAYHWHTHHRGSVSIQIMSIRDSNINLQQAVSHASAPASADGTNLDLAYPQFAKKLRVYNIIEF
jgi:hypothetical protein